MSHAFPIGRAAGVALWALGLTCGCASNSTESYSSDVAPSTAIASLPAGSGFSSPAVWTPASTPALPRATFNPDAPMTPPAAPIAKAVAPTPAPRPAYATYAPPVARAQPNPQIYSPPTASSASHQTLGFQPVASVSAATANTPAHVKSLSQQLNPADLRVMTFNLRVNTFLDGLNMWNMRRESVVERVRSFNPDLFGTQEGLDGQEQFLRESLYDYTFFGVGRNDGKHSGEMVGVFYKTARFDCLDSGHFWLSKTPEKAGSRAWGEIFPRMVTWVKLQPKDGARGGQTFYWFNTHFDAWNSHARAESAKLFRERITQIAGATPCIVTGDFNAVPNSDPYHTMVAANSTPAETLFDAFRAANPTPVREEGTMHSFSGRRDGQRIDWVLATPFFQAVSAVIDHTRGTVGYPSDHFPVTVTLRPANVATAVKAAAPPKTTTAVPAKPTTPVAKIE